MATLVAAVALTAGTFLIPPNQPLANILTAINFALYAPHYFLPYEAMQAFRQTPEYTKRGVPSWACDDDDETTNFDTNFAAPSTTHQSATLPTDNSYKIQEVYLLDEKQVSLLTTTYELVSGIYVPRLALPGHPISVTLTLGEDYIPPTTISSVPTSTSAWYNWAATKTPVAPPPTPVVPEVNTSASAGLLAFVMAIFSRTICAAIAALRPEFEKIRTLLDVLIYLFVILPIYTIKSLLDFASTCISNYGLPALRPEFEKLRTLLDLFIYLCFTLPIHMASCLWDFARTCIANYGSELWLFGLLLIPWVIILVLDSGYQPLENAIVFLKLWLLDKLRMFIVEWPQRVINAFLRVLNTLRPYCRSILAAVLVIAIKVCFGIVFPLLWLVDKLNMLIERFNQRAIEGFLHDISYTNFYWRFWPALVLFNMSRIWVQGALPWKIVSLINYLVCALFIMIRLVRASRRFKGAVAWSIGWLLHKLNMAFNVLMALSALFIIGHLFTTFVTEFTDWELESTTDTLLVGCAGILLFFAPFVFGYFAWKYAVVERIRGFSARIQRIVITLFQAIVRKFQQAYVATRAFASSQIRKARLKAQQALSNRKRRISLAILITLVVLVLIDFIADFLEEFVASRIAHITFASFSKRTNWPSLLQSLFASVEAAFDSIGDSSLRFLNAILTKFEQVFPGLYSRIPGPIFAKLRTSIVDHCTHTAAVIFETLQHSIVEPYMRAASPVWAALQTFANWLITRLILKWRRRTHNMVCSNTIETFMATIALNQFVPFGRSTFPNLAMALMTLICGSLDIARYTIIPFCDKMRQAAAALFLSQIPFIALRTVLVTGSVVRIVQDWRLLNFRMSYPFFLRGTMRLLLAWLFWPHVFGVWDWVVVAMTVLCVLAIKSWAYIWSNLPVGIQDATRACVEKIPFHMIRRFAGIVVAHAQVLWQTARQGAIYVWQDMTNTLPAEDAVPVPRPPPVAEPGQIVTPELAHTSPPPTTPPGEAITASPGTPEPTLPAAPNAETPSPQDSKISTTPEPSSDADMPPNDSGIGGSSAEWKPVQQRASKARSTNANSPHSGSSGETTPRSVPSPRSGAAVSQSTGRYDVLADSDNGDGNYGGAGGEES
ncbi:hypothetical protein IQ07DRAFT_604771 [Pyrenochaeta sp. DS3sAY3a]|nr:hypothetical protein IQ07DRAFT_604771 [Pyrenochaeta sp. DS3sAY3a]